MTTRSFPDAKGQARGASCRRRLGGASALDGASNDGLWRAGDDGVLAVPWRTVLIMAVATVQGRYRGFVQRVEGAEGRARARGES
jgi:hypothetical protein